MDALSLLFMGFVSIFLIVITMVVVEQQSLKSQCREAGGHTITGLFGDFEYCYNKQGN